MRDIIINREKNEVIMTSKFSRKADDPRTDEFRLLQEVKALYPNIIVKNHRIKKNPNKECYRGLTYEYMREYILVIREQLLAIRKTNSLEIQYPEIAKQWNKEKNGGITPSMISPTTGIKYWWTCTECGYVWQAAVSSRTNGHTGCPRCSGFISKGDVVFNKELLSVNTSVMPLDSYITALTPIRFKCLICGHIWSSTPSHILEGRGCPNCRDNKKKNTYYLKVAELHPNIKIISKYEGNTKRIKCICNKCGFEWEPYAKTLLKKGGCPQCEIKHIKTNEYFIDELQRKNPTVTPLEEYNGAHNLIKLKCNVCGNIWSAKPNSLLNGQGCPNCNSSLKTNEEFKKELSKKCPSVVSLDTYNGINGSIRFMCMDCGYEWIDKPTLILRRKNPCPNCKKNVRHFNMKTTEAFIKEMKCINPNVEIVGEYIGVHKPITFKCLLCGTIQNKTPHELLKGRGCKCSK